IASPTGNPALALPPVRMLVITALAAVAWSETSTTCESEGSESRTGSAASSVNGSADGPNPMPPSRRPAPVRGTGPTLADAVLGVATAPARPSEATVGWDCASPGTGPTGRPSA